ncbi:NAD(P)H-dependent flavin oxidoreductase [Microbacterium sp. No. 7]|uniref:NAD(P)H-dependent flavin oxidoreductase n=1 Tax=Microbacterium sp. No. 7 TaxID=1714373 RepID=UPI0006CF3B52|nr:nitronate monooxygenase [Microbacterium sp. No. 7]ALJ21698.1 2-nitropropane dioxygenase [Microbacterium sp. No. 7]
MTLPENVSARLRLPAIAAPMTGVSGIELVAAACEAGVIGSFPVHNARRDTSLGDWLTTLERRLQQSEGTPAPFAPNLIMHSSNRYRDEELATLVAHGVELVITSVGSPARAVEPLHAVGALVLADVATLAHAEKALEAGADGLVLLTAGAGGQTGWLNPFAFVRGVRAFFDGPIVLAGGISDGVSAFAAEVLGADLVYLGTRVIATEESLADDAYRAALVAATADDVVLSSAVGGLPANLLRSWIERNDADVAQGDYQQERLLGWQGVWSAGHAVAGVTEVLPVRDVIAELIDQYEAARAALRNPGA